MITFKGFSGINNVQPQPEMKVSDLVQAVNIDLDNEGRAMRRQGYTLAAAGVRRNLFEAKSGTLFASVEDGSLVARAGAIETAVHTAIGPDRIWYADLPDGTVLFSNGLIAGITDGLTSHALGVPVPQASGSFTSIPGALQPGRYQWATTYVRLSDGLEGGTSDGGLAEVSEGGILLSGLPLRDGYKTVVYLSKANGTEMCLAGETFGPAFSFVGPDSDLVVPCRTQFMVPMPAGNLCTFWRTRTLVAVGDTLVASRPDQWELHDPSRDVKRFTAPITLIQPVDDGIYIGTEHELAFLSGTNFDGLVYSCRLSSRVVLGSGVKVPAESIGEGDSKGLGMMCIAGGNICAGRAGGSVTEMTSDRYKVADSITEVYAAFREVRGIPQYLATPK